MKKLTKDEADKLFKGPQGFYSPTRAYLLAMNVGEVILLEKSDWPRKTQTPFTYCNWLGKRTGRLWKCEPLVDKTGWVIERLK
jgi:hypothetical protein